MKLNIIKTIRTLALGLGLALGLNMVSTASAASLQLWVYTGGKWAIILSTPTGGKVIPNKTYGWQTDRAQRGEPLEVDVWAKTAAELKNPIISKCWLSSTGGTKVINSWWWGPYMDPAAGATAYFSVPTSAAWDNNYFNVTTASGTFSVRIPIGGR